MVYGTQSSCSTSGASGVNDFRHLDLYRVRGLLTGRPVPLCPDWRLGTASVVSGTKG